GGALVITGDSTGTTGGVAAVAGTSYGRWEARIAGPARDRQTHPVALLWPDSGDWPCAGEIDLAETGADRADVDFFLHHSCTNEQVTTRTPVDLAQWHNYAVDWSPTCV